MSDSVTLPNHVVRRKASQRKGRTETLEHRARRPLQKRSLDRFNSILEATEVLLETANIEDISFYDIARQADLPPASVHYLSRRCLRSESKCASCSTSRYSR